MLLGYKSSKLDTTSRSQGRHTISKSLSWTRTSAKEESPVSALPPNNANGQWCTTRPWSSSFLIRTWWPTSDTKSWKDSKTHGRTFRLVITESSIASAQPQWWVFLETENPKSSPVPSARMSTPDQYAKCQTIEIQSQWVLHKWVHLTHTTTIRACIMRRLLLLMNLRSSRKLKPECELSTMFQRM